VKLNPPEKLDFAKPQEWADWKQQFERFRYSTKLNKEEDVLQLNALIFTMEKEAEHIFKAMTFEEGNENTLRLLRNLKTILYQRRILFTSEHIFIMFQM